MFCAALMLQKRSAMRDVVISQWQLGAVGVCFGQLILALQLASRVLGTRWFIHIIFIIRVLLLTPYLIAKYPKHGSSTTMRRLAKYKWTVLLPALYMTIQSMRIWRIGSLMQSLNNNPATAALGYDAIVAISSLVILYADKHARDMLLT